jgi:acid phosphatase
MAGAPAHIPERWPLCKEARRFRAAVGGTGNSSTGPRLLDVTRIVEQPDGATAEGEWCVAPPPPARVRS